MGGAFVEGAPLSSGALACQEPTLGPLTLSPAPRQPSTPSTATAGEDTHHTPA